MNAKSKKTASKKPVPAKKAAKTAATPKAVAKKVVKKPVAVKTPAKSAKPAAKPVAKKAAPAKAAAKKVVAKKAPAKKPVAPKAAPKKVVAKKAAAPAKKAVAKKAPAKVVKAPAKAVKVQAKAVKAVAKPVAKKAVAKPAVKVATKAAPKPAPKAATKAVAKPVVKAAPVKKAPAAKPAPVKAAVVKAAKPAKEPKVKVVVTPAPIVHVTPIIPGYTPVVHKKNSRAAKMAALVPPPPAQVVASNAAKNSFMPMTAPSAPTIVPVIPKKDAKLANNWKTKTADQLTDAEIIAMPDSEYMNDIQMAFFRLKLVQLKNEVLSNASETTEHLREDTVVVPDPADRATIEEEHALELRTRDRERKLLKKIEQSIQRIDSGDYGYCDETGEAIGVGRLLARPTASLSLEAQERREIKQRMFGD
ncbi:RNA polymerase-binding protein DksA [Limnohabitans curvus]|uniref:RNA polymerase-binding protein DksA n=1 Tax=Limnohabitans curvus TaxID=323423 RepID=UPI001FE5C324|nr:RNA polymerase-binding protein DksA [Limnohabitans curvus]